MPDAVYFESMMLIFFSMNWYWSIARMLRAGASDGKSMTANLLIAFGYACAIIAKLEGASGLDALPVVFWICCWNLMLTLLDLWLIYRYRPRAVFSGLPE